MTNPFGAIDLFAGQNAISGTDLFGLDKNPLNVLSLGQGLLDDAVTAIENAIDEAIQNVPKFFEAFFYFLGELTEDMVNDILTFFGLPNLPPGASVEVIGQIFALPMEILNDLLTFLGLGTVNTVEAGLILGEVIQRPALFLEFLLEGLGLPADLTSADGLVAFLENLGGDVISGIGNFLDALLSGLGLEGITGPVGAELAALINSLAPLSTVNALFDEAIATIDNAVGQTLNFLVSFVDSLVGAVVGTVENVFPLITPLVIGAETTIGDLTGFLTSLASVHDLQSLQDLIYNTLTGIQGGIGWVSGVTTGTLTLALQELYAGLTTTAHQANNALISVGDLVVSVNQQIENAFALIPSGNLVGVIEQDLIPDITLEMSTALQTLINDLTNNFAGLQNPGVNATFTDLADALAGVNFNVQTAVTDAGTAVSNLLSLFESVGQATIGEFTTWLTGVTQHLDAVTGEFDATFLANVDELTGFAISAITGLAGYLTNLTVTGQFDAAFLTDIENIPALAIASITGLEGYLSNLDASGVYVANLAISAVTGLAGYLSNIASNGVINVAGLAGALTSAVTVGAASDIAALIGTVVGTVENDLPLALPYTIGTTTTLPDLAAFLSSLATQTSLQGLQDLIFNTLSGLPQLSWVTGTTSQQLAQAMAEFSATASSAQSMAAQALANVEAVLAGLGEITIPNESLSGLLGETVANTEGLAGQVQKALNSLINGFNGSAILGGTVAQLQQAANGIASLLGWNPTGPPPAQSISAITQTHTDFIANLAAAKPNYAALLKGADVTFPATALLSTVSAPTVGVTQTASLIGYITTNTGGTKKSVGWLGGATTNISSIVVNIYQVNIDTGDMSLISTSGNLLASANPPGNNVVPEWTYWNFSDTGNPDIVTAQGNVYGVEIQTLGTGTYEVVGLSSATWINPHPTAIPAGWAASRTTLAPPTFDAAALTATTSDDSPDPLTWTHVVGANATAIVVGILLFTDSGSGPTAVSCGGHSLGLIPSGFQFYNPGGESWNLYFYGLIDPPTGSQTMSVTYTGGNNVVTVMSASYAGVSNFGTQVTASGEGTHAFQTIASSVGQTLVNMIGDTATSTALIEYSQNVRENLTGNAGGFDTYTSALGDAAGSSSPITFSANVQGTGTIQWGSITVPLNGVVPPAPALLPAPAPVTMVPYLELAGSAGQTQYAPDLYTFDSPGTTYFTPPSWANFIDVIVCSDGGAGETGGPLEGGAGGAPGSFFGFTITPAQFVDGVWTIFVGGGGAPNFSTPAGGGGNGQGCSVAIPGYAPPGGSVPGSPLLIAGGLGGPQGGISGSQLGGPGGTPSNFLFNGQEYVGGGVAGSSQQPGLIPGGGGAGGAGEFVGRFIYGGPGAPGTIWILCYQYEGQN
jgi:hypothetical protein